MPRVFLNKRARTAALILCILLPALLGAYAYFELNRPPVQYGVELTLADYLTRNADLLLGVLFLAISGVPFFLMFDRRRPQARELIPIAVMAALAVVGRTVFAAIPLPNFKPVTAIVIIAAVAFGPEAGFLTGATAAFASNFIFGQGPWTPWQMFCWGMIGFAAGALKRVGFFCAKSKKEYFHSPVWNRLCPQDTVRGDLLAMARSVTARAPMGLCLFGLGCGIGYGWVMNLYYLVGYVDPITWQALGMIYVSSILFDVSHGVCTFLVLWALAEPWLRKLERVKLKFALVDGRTPYAMPPKSEGGQSRATSD